jgi:hypothetical protein
MNTGVTLRRHFGLALFPRVSPSSRSGLLVLTPILAAVTKRGTWLNIPLVWMAKQLKRQVCPSIGLAYLTRQLLTLPHPPTIHRRACLRSTAIIQPHAKSE